MNVIRNFKPCRFGDCLCLSNDMIPAWRPWAYLMEDLLLEHLLKNKADPNLSVVQILINNSKMWKQSFGAIDIFPLREETDWLVLGDNKACSGPREMKDSVASKVVEDPMDYRWGLLHCSFKRDLLKRQSNTSHLAVSIPRVVSQGMPGLPGEKGESGHVGLMVRGRHYFHSLDSSYLSQ